MNNEVDVNSILSLVKLDKCNKNDSNCKKVQSTQRIFNINLSENKASRKYVFFHTSNLFFHVVPSFLVIRYINSKTLWLLYHTVHFNVSSPYYFLLKSSSNRCKHSTTRLKSSGCPISGEQDAQ